MQRFHDIVVVVDNELSRDSYSVTGGNLSDIGVTVLNTLNVPLMDGMTGKNLIIHKSIKGGKKSNKTLLIIVIFIILMAALVFGLYYMGLI